MIAKTAATDEKGVTRWKELKCRAGETLALPSLIKVIADRAQELEERPPSSSSVPAMSSSTRDSQSERASTSSSHVGTKPDELVLVADMRASLSAPLR